VKIPRWKEPHYFFQDFENLYPFFLDTCGKSDISELFIALLKNAQGVNGHSLSRLET
jgi:hypothetical protein